MLTPALMSMFRTEFILLRGIGKGLLPRSFLCDSTTGEEFHHIIRTKMAILAHVLHFYSLG